MPRFTAETASSGGSTFGFSAIDISTLGATEYTLVGIALDGSGSVYPFAAEEEKALQAIVASCRRSPRADNLMLRVTRFDHLIGEVHGFKLLTDCQTADYVNCIQPNGSTALYDATVDSVDALARYGKELQANDLCANAILFVVTDGWDNASTMRANNVKQSIARALQAENLESIVTILIGVNVTDTHTAGLLSDYARDAGFTKFVNIGEADEKKLAKLAEFVSKSISSQSQSLGSGGPSQALPSI